MRPLSQLFYFLIGTATAVAILIYFPELKFKTVTKIAVSLIAILVQVHFAAIYFNCYLSNVAVYIIFQIFYRMANISNDEKNMIGLPVEDEEEEEDEGK